MQLSSERRKVLIVATTFPMPGIKGIPPFVQTLANSVSDQFELKIQTIGRLKQRTDSRARIENGLCVQRTTRRSDNEGSGILSSLAPRTFVRECWLLARFTINLVMDLRQNEYELVHIHWGAPFPSIVRILRAIGLIPRDLRYVVSMHGADVLLFGSKFSPVMKFGLRGASLWTAVNRRDLAYVRSKLGGSAPSSLLLPMPVDPIFSQKPSSYNENRRDKLRLLYVGRLVPKKGAREFLDAIQYLKHPENFEITVVGSGPLKDSLQSEFDDIAQFLGACSPREIRTLLDNSTIFVAPFIDQPNDREGLPVTILEAASVGVPIVTSPIAGILDLMEAGMVFEICSEPQDAQRLAVALQNTASRVWNFDQSLNKELISNRTIVERNFDEYARQTIMNIYSG